jgi:hypothetical protein
LLALDQYASDAHAVHEFSYGTKWDLSTLSYTNDAFAIGAEINESAGVDTDGDTLLVCGSDADRIYRYNFGSSWDASTLSGPDGFYEGFNDEEEAARGITTDGSTLVLAGANTDTLYQYSFGTDWDPTTLSYDNTSYDISGETTLVNGVYSDGEYLVLIDAQDNQIEQYNYGTEWDTSTLTHYAEVDAFPPSGGCKGVASGDGVVVVSDSGDRKLYSFSYVPEFRVPER